MEEKIKWEVEFKSYEQAKTMPLDRAKIEALRRIAEQLEQLNNKIDVFENVAEQLEKLDKTLENLNFNLVKE